jgi:hypothetical protein
VPLLVFALISHSIVTHRVSCCSVEDGISSGRRIIVVVVVVVGGGGGWRR